MNTLKDDPMFEIAWKAYWLAVNEHLVTFFKKTNKEATKITASLNKSKNELCLNDHPYIMAATLIGQENVTLKEFKAVRRQSNAIVEKARKQASKIDK